MKIEEVIMTPALARTLLADNAINRKLSQSRVRGLKAIIERGEWQMDGNPIKQGEDGTLIDGQHRLEAIAEAGIGVPVILITGMPVAVRLSVDAGKTRTFADYLTIRGVPNGLSMASVVRTFWNWENDLFTWDQDWFLRPSPSHAQLWELFEKRTEDFRDALSRANSVLRVVRAARSPIAAGWLIFGDVECEKCGPAVDDREEFYDLLALRSVHPTRNVSAFIQLMNRKERTEIEVGRSIYSQTVQLALLIKTWNAYREGRDIGTLRFTRGGRAREKFPIPH